MRAFDASPVVGASVKADMLVPTSFRSSEGRVTGNRGRIWLAVAALAIAGATSRADAADAPVPRPEGWTAADAHVARALALAREQRPGEATTELRAALLAAPTHAEARRQLALALLDAGDAEQATREAEILVVCEPQWAEAHYLVALARSRSSATDGAEARATSELEQALALSPDHLGALYLSALLELRAGDAEAAIPRLERLTALAPQWAQAHHALGTALVRAGRREEGAHSLATFADLDERQRALTAAWRAIQREPRSPEAHYRAARVLLEHDLRDQARQALLNVLTLDPWHASARRDLAALLSSERRDGMATAAALSR
jgi:tetratricopeptide (TPR) repeat protein